MILHVKMACLLLHCTCVIIVQYQLTPPSGVKEHVDPDWGGGVYRVVVNIESNRHVISCAKAGSFSCFFKESTMPLT